MFGKAKCVWGKIFYVDISNFEQFLYNLKGMVPILRHVHRYILKHILALSITCHKCNQTFRAAAIYFWFFFFSKYWYIVRIRKFISFFPIWQHCIIFKFQFWRSKAQLLFIIHVEERDKKISNDHVIKYQIFSAGWTQMRRAFCLT